MKLNKQDIEFSIKWYFTTLIIFNCFSCLIFLVFPENKDWELFSFNFFGSLIIYTLSFLIFFGLSKFLDFINRGSFSRLITLLILMDLISIFIANKSIVFSIFTSMIETENYILLFYPLSPIFYLYCIYPFILKK